jgi:hypothetical protein
MNGYHNLYIDILNPKLEINCDGIKKYSTNNYDTIKQKKSDNDITLVNKINNGFFNAYAMLYRDINLSKASIVFTILCIILYLFTRILYL